MNQKSRRLFYKMTILGLKRKFDSLDTNRVIEEVISDSTSILADLNTEQINSGIRADGSLMPDYSLRSVIQYGKQPGPIRLRDTGAWQSGLYARVIGDRIQFASTDSKDAMLVERYGPEIEGLSEKFKNEAMIEKIRPEFRNKILNAVGLLMK